MANEKINAYIEQIRLIIDRQLDLVYEYHNSKAVYGYADDFPFFNLFVNFKKNLYEGLVKDLYMQGRDIAALLNELNGLPEFKEMGIEIKATPDGLDFPKIWQFSNKIMDKDYTYYCLKLFPYCRYVLGLEYIIFKFAPVLIEKLYSEEYWDAMSMVFTDLTFFDSIVFSDEDWIDENGNRVSERMAIASPIKRKRFVEQVDYYNYCCYRRYDYLQDKPELDEWYGSKDWSEGENLWEINVDKTFGVCLAKNIGKENEEIIDFLVSVPYLTEALVRAFHDVKSGGCRLIDEEHYEGTPGLHLTEKYKKTIKEKLAEYYSQGYVDVTHSEDFGAISNDGIYFFDLAAIDRNKQYWDKEDEPKFLDKQHYLNLLRPLKDPLDYPGEELKPLEEEPIDKVSKQKFVNRYMNFFISKLNIVVREKKGIFKSPSMIEEIIRKTYQGMHKSYVSSAITIKTARVGSKTSKTAIQKELKIRNDFFSDYTHYYRDGKFDNEQLKRISELIDYELLERIE